MGMGLFVNRVCFGFRASGFEFPHLCGRGADAGAGHYWNVGPTVNMLAGANPDGRPGLRHPVAGNVKLGDVAPAVGRGWQQPQKREMLHTANASPDRGGAFHQRVLGRRARDAKVESNPATGIGNDQLGHGVGTEDRCSGREVELGKAEIGAPSDQTRKEVIAVQALPVARFGDQVMPGRNLAPGGVLFGARDRSKPHSSMARALSPDSCAKKGEASPESGLQNLCPSVFICASLLRVYG